VSSQTTEVRPCCAFGGDLPDMMITPRLGRIGLFDFHCAEEAIEIGAEAAKRSMQAITEAIEALG